MWVNVTQTHNKILKGHFCGLFFYLKVVRILLIFFLFFENKRHAEELKIIPSFKILKLLALKVSPEDVISVIISDDPVKG